MPRSADHPRARADATGFYRIDLLAGAAILIDNLSRDKPDHFGDPVIDIAIALKQ